MEKKRIGEEENWKRGLEKKRIGEEENGKNKRIEKEREKGERNINV